jgi:hypothetical protein
MTARSTGSSSSSVPISIVFGVNGSYETGEALALLAQCQAGIGNGAADLAIGQQGDHHIGVRFLGARSRGCRFRRLCRNGRRR